MTMTRDEMVVFSRQLREEYDYKGENKSGLVVVSESEIVKASDIITQLLSELDKRAPAQSEWRLIDHANFQEGAYIFTMKVTDNTYGNYTYWDSYCLVYTDEGELLELCGDAFSTWQFEDFTHYMPLPQPPSSSTEETEA